MNPAEQKQIDLLEQIAAQLKIAGGDNRLWSLDDIAAYIGLSKSSVQNRIICKPGFPKPIKLNEERSRRWLPKEVKEWVLSHQGQRKKPGRPRNTI